MKIKTLLYALLWLAVATGCHSRQKEEINILPHPINPQADSLYRQAIVLLQSSFDVDSTRKCIRILDEALQIDSLNPDYYGIKAKLLSEMGELDSAIYVQTLALERKAITGEYLLQLGLFQAARDMDDKAHESFRQSKLFLDAVLERYPDSLGAFIWAEAANSLYEKQDSLFMRDIDAIRKRFADRLLDIEMTRRVNPSSLVKQIKQIQMKKETHVDFDLDSLVLDAVKRDEQESGRN